MSQTLRDTRDRQQRTARRRWPRSWPAPCEPPVAGRRRPSFPGDIDRERRGQRRARRTRAPRRASARPATSPAARIMSSQSEIDSAVQNDHSTQITVNVPDVRNTMPAARRGAFACFASVRARRCFVSYSEFTITSDAEHDPEDHVVPLQQERPPNPEPLHDVEEPGGDEREGGGEHQRLRVAEPAQTEEGRIVEDLHHEVFPIDVDPPPEVREARRQEVAVMRLREIEAEEVQHPDDDMEVPRDAEVQQVGRQHVDEELAEVGDRDRVERQSVVDDAIQNQLQQATPDPLDADLIDRVPLGVVVVAAELLEVDDRKERKADVGQQEEVAERLRQTLAASSRGCDRRDRRSSAARTSIPGPARRPRTRARRRSRSEAPQARRRLRRGSRPARSSAPADGRCQSAPGRW